MPPLLLDVLRPEIERTALVEAARQILFGFESGDVLVHGRQRRQIEPSCDLLIARTIAVVGNEFRNEIENLFLTLGDGPGD